VKTHTTKVRKIISAMAFGLGFVGFVYADTTPSNPNVENPHAMPFYAGPLDQTLMTAPASVPTPPNKTYILPATPATTQWGIFNANLQPVLKINSGDTVVIQTLPAADNQVVPGVKIEKIIQMNNAVPGRGPHTLTGPIAVAGAEPGDILSIHINSITPIAYASNDCVPGKGLFPELFPNGQVSYYHIDLKNKQIQFAPGIIIPLAPFPGIIAVAPAASGVFDSVPPGVYGGNMDLRVLTQGTTLYLPVFKKGAMIWSGDSHAAQGNGEIDLTAMETAFSEISITIKLIKDKKLVWPEVETPTHWVTVGYDTDLNKALDITKAQTVAFIMQQHHVSKQKATDIMYQIWDCPISEVVDGVKGAYCMIPKDFNAIATPLPSTDNTHEFVTVATDPDALVAMSKASMAMLKKVSAAKNMSIQQVYILSSFVLDCRFAPYVSGNKEVHCMMPKNIWVSQTSRS
jgi:acetamidase/formamidase